MKGIEKITDRILSEAREEAEAIKAEASAKAEEILADYEGQAKETYEARMESGKKEAADAADRKIRAAGLQSRKDVLAAKQEMIEAAYAAAKETILNMPEAEYIEFLAEKASRASVSGTEQIALNEADQKKIGDALVKAANEKLAAAGKKAELSLSQETAAITGGLFLREKDISVNCSIDSLMAICREELDVKVSKVLFRG